MAQFHNHINFFQSIVKVLTEDDTSTLPNGKRLVDEEKRARCLAKVKAYGDGCLAKEAALKAAEEAFELKPMPVIDIWTSYDNSDDDVHEEQKCTTNLDEDVSEFDLFGDEDEPPVKKARSSNAEGKRPAV